MCNGVRCVELVTCELPPASDLLPGTDDDLLGSAVGVVGDVSGDGVADVVVSAPGFNDRAIVVFGGAALDEAQVEKADAGLPGAGFKLDYMLADTKVDSIAAAGDVNGDGFGDLLVGVPEVDNGNAYVVFGKAGTAPVSLGSVDVDGTGVRIFAGPLAKNFGTSVAGGLDVDGDGASDLAVGSPEPGVGGAVYVVFGAPGLDYVQADNISAGFEITSGANDWDVGRSVALVPDLNGDGRAEVMVGAPTYAVDKGRAFVVFGKADNSPIALDNLGAAGFAITTTKGGVNLGEHVAAAGDVNGDGVSDLAVTAPGFATIVIFGGGGVNVNVDALGGGGMTVFGAPGVGARARGAGDINGDGLGDLAIGSPLGRTVYLVLGTVQGGMILLADVAMDIGGFTILSSDPISKLGADLGAGAIFGGPAPGLAIGDWQFDLDEGTVRFVTPGICPL